MCCHVHRILEQRGCGCGCGYEYGDEVIDKNTCERAQEFGSGMFGFDFI